MFLQPVVAYCQHGNKLRQPLDNPSKKYVMKTYFVELSISVVLTQKLKKSNTINCQWHYVYDVFKVSQAFTNNKRRTVYGLYHASILSIYTFIKQPFQFLLRRQYNQTRSIRKFQRELHNHVGGA